MNSLKLSAMAFAVLALTGCASIIEGTSQDVTVDTPGVDAAQCELTSERIGRQNVTTPGTVSLKRSKHDVDVICRKACYHDARATIDSGLEPWTLGNILLGGIIGLGVDAGTGALNKYDEPAHVSMQADQACAAATAAPVAGMVMPQQTPMAQSYTMQAPQAVAQQPAQNVYQQQPAPAAAQPVAPVAPAANTTGSVLPMSN